MANITSVQKLPIFHAGSLTATFAKVNAEFKKLHPDVEIVSEPAGSADTVRRVTEQKRECGILASADYKLIPEMMFPDFADWYIIFASDQIVLCYSDKSKYHDAVSRNNWYEILQREGVTYALHDPDQDPGGYRTLIVWQLAEKYYGIPGLYPKLSNSQGYKILSGNLIALCESGQIDYTFSYRAVAVQNHAKYIALPDNINLASRKFEDFYRQAQVKIRGSKPGEVVTINGEPILFALTVPKNFDDQKLAASWVSFLLSDKGVDIMKSMGMNPIKPAITNDAGKLPESLNNYV
jgi:molybdate/tungstate transport system substrate-binding protein